MFKHIMLPTDGSGLLHQAVAGKVLRGRNCGARIVALLLAALCAPAALAQHGHGTGPGPGHGGGHGGGHGQVHRGGGPHGLGDFRFHGHDGGAWRGGHWSHARYGGRVGWFWVVGPSWYYYPYPTPWAPAVVVGAPPGAIGPLPPAQYWYYCEASGNYYPYVNYCPAPWQPVPAPMPQEP